MTSKHFIPSSAKLLSMIANAEAKCDASIEQARLRRESEADRRMERAWVAQAEAIRRRRLYGEPTNA